MKMLFVLGKDARRCVGDALEKMHGNMGNHLVKCLDHRSFETVACGEEIFDVGVFDLAFETPERGSLSVRERMLEFIGQMRKSGRCARFVVIVPWDCSWHDRVKEALGGAPLHLILSNRCTGTELISAIHQVFNLGVVVA